jgi:hypothetical protein
VNALLDFIEANTDPSDPAQVHAREWAQRMRELHERLNELIEKIVALIAADDPDQLDAFVSAVAERNKVSAELAQLCHRMEGVSVLVHPSTETMQ